MRKISISFMGLTMALALAVTACGDDVTGVTSGDELTASEVSAVMAALGSAFASAGVQPAAAPAQAAIDVGGPIDETVLCDSGSIDLSGSMSGSIDDQTLDIDITMDVTFDPSGCVVSNENNTFTLEGAPSIELSLTMVSTLDGLTMDGTESGGFSYTSSDGRIGSCAINVTYSVVTSGEATSSTVTGTICGMSAAEFETLGT